MAILRILFTLSLGAGLLLTSCSPVIPAATATFIPQPTSSPTEVLLTSAPTAAGIPALVFQYNKGELMVISPETGQPLDSYEPITFRDSYSYAFAPDGHSLAFVANPQLYVIDMPSWNIHEYDLGLHGWISSMVYSSDGSLLALASGDPESNLWIVNPKSGKITASQQADFSIRKIQFNREGKALMAYGPRIANKGVAANAGVSVGPPKAALYSSSELKLLWSTELDGVRDGTFPKKEDAEITKDIYLPGAAWHYEPGIAFSPTQDTLYLIHGDEDKLTTVDFRGKNVRTVDVQARTSWLDRFMAWTAGVAYAKGMDGTTKKALISPDGKLLFVGGMTETVEQPTDSSGLNITVTPIGLQVISASDGTLLADIKSETTLTGLSPDGKYIFLAGKKDPNRPEILSTDIYDPASMNLIHHMDNISLMPTYRLDGMPILVSTQYAGSNGNDVCFQATVDPTTWAVISRWNGKCINWLTP